MERYVKKIKEQEDNFSEKITEILSILRDENFGNEEQRKYLIDLLTTMHNSKDKRARMAFRKIGDLFTDVADDLINIEN